ncbi:FimB/Mfa2 family fimbrial subunit [Bacteroides intestinalis]|uniref:FimB/Mfa2 family fimbrial subunit n=1 Tax=Bacteroides intestinalis TaxID=329854 RepID=UPI00293D9739|nr:FimB/Mfa2 family fimbrial subunit [Bacteroides intestinalis]
METILNERRRNMKRKNKNRMCHSSKIIAVCKRGASTCVAVITLVAVFSLSGCVKDELHNTPHPDKGAVRVTTDWSIRSSDAVLPADYILHISNEEQTVQGETNTFKSQFLPGSQSLLVYHQAEGVTINGTTATVNSLADGTLNPLPGFLFSATRELDIPKDDTLKVAVPMKQHIRTLTLTLKLNPGDERRIASTAATLTNIASVMDLTTGAIAATGGKTTVPVFVPGTDNGQTRATGQPVLSATMRLLGVTTGAQQVLALKITLTDGYVQTLTTDLTEALKNFGSNLKPLELDARLELQTDGQFSGTITGWDVKEDITIDAD